MFVCSMKQHKLRFPDVSGIISTGLILTDKSDYQFQINSKGSFVLLRRDNRLVEIYLLHLRGDLYRSYESLTVNIHLIEN